MVTSVCWLGPRVPPAVAVDEAVVAGGHPVQRLATAVADDDAARGALDPEVEQGPGRGELRGRRGRGRHDGGRRRRGGRRLERGDGRGDGGRGRRRQRRRDRDAHGVERRRDRGAEARVVDGVDAAGVAAPGGEDDRGDAGGGDQADAGGDDPPAPFAPHAGQLRSIDSTSGASAVRRACAACELEPAPQPARFERDALPRVAGERPVRAESSSHRPLFVHHPGATVDGPVDRVGFGVDGQRVRATLEVEPSPPQAARPGAIG